LAVQDLYLLLFRCDLQEIQQLVSAYLSGRVQDAPSIISAASNQEEGWESFEYVELEDGPPFTAWLEVAITGEWFQQFRVHSRLENRLLAITLVWLG
jgi:hypothetical protein